MNTNKQKLIKTLLILLGIILLVGFLRVTLNRNSMSLSDYDKMYQESK